MSCVPSACAVWVMNTDGTSAHQVRELGGYAYLYDWSPSGWLYYAADFDHAGWADDMRRITPEGDAEAVLVSGPTGGASERYDAARVAYVRGLCCWAPSAETRVMDFDGANDTVILAPDGKSEQWVSYSHSSAEFLFHQADGAAGYGFPYNIYEIKDDGTGLRQITSSDGAAGFTEPVYSPDDTAIAAMRWLPGRGDPDIVILDQAGMVVSEVATTTATEQSPDWAVVCNEPTCVFGPSTQPLTCVRGKGKPASEGFSWESCGGEGMVTIRTEHASSAWVSLNGSVILTPRATQHEFRFA